MKYALDARKPKSTVHKFRSSPHSTPYGIYVPLPTLATCSGIQPLFTSPYALLSTSSNSSAAASYKTQFLYIFPIFSSTPLPLPRSPTLLPFYFPSISFHRDRCLKPFARSSRSLSSIHYYLYLPLWSLISRGTK